MSSTCQKTHELFNAVPRHSFPFDESKIPDNGIYILFEKGEEAHGANRIVRIGTHTGRDQLISRLYQHFVQENKDRSIFRKNIGRCFLHKKDDPYLKIWEMDFTTSDMKKKAHLIDSSYQEKIEKQVSTYIQNAFTFAVLQVNRKDERLSLEAKIISTVSLCDACSPSPKWLGRSSPKDKIVESGLWQVNELYKKPLSTQDLNRLKELSKDY